MTEEISFAELALSAPLQRALSENGYTKPSPIQALAIPPLLEGRDLLGSAQTGTGKTAAFALPILHRLEAAKKPPQPNRPHALILTPTRELAVQVAESFAKYGKHLRLSYGTAYGGVGMFPQIRALRRGLDILVATPGRLLDLCRQGHLKLDAVRFFVLDEADRMLDMGFLPDIRTVVKDLPKERQSLFFSATLSQEITQLAGGILRDPVDVRITPQKTTAENIEHRVCFVQPVNKNELLQDLLYEQQEREGRHLTLVFSRTKHGADKLSKALNRNGLRSEAIHGNKTQAARQRALENFREGRSAVLVATDVAARGIDVRDITLVVNFDMPVEPESYIHRIGRTARAGHSGRALSFCNETELTHLRAIEKLLRSKVEPHTGHSFHCTKTSDRNDRAEAPRSSNRSSRFSAKSHSRGGDKPFRGRSSSSRGAKGSFSKNAGGGAKSFSAFRNN
jgi:ATP-dependent RNA helicase RhlE